MIKATNIHKRFGDIEVLVGIDLEVKPTEIVSLVGASGAGKSTLLQILGTLDRADSGTVMINSQEVSKFKDQELSAFRNKHIGFVFQFHHLLPEFTALENVCMPAFIGGKNRNATLKKGKELLDYMGLSHRLEHKPNKMSGGEQQRVAIARALINDPAVVMADEPTGNLDSENSDEIHKLFFKLRNEFNQTFLIVTHNQQLADMADRKLTMKDGVFI